MKSKKRTIKSTIKKTINRTIKKAIKTTRSPAKAKAKRATPKTNTIVKKGTTKAKTKKTTNPAKRQTTPVRMTEKGNQPKKGQKRILIVDDEQDIRSTVSSVLKQAGYAVDTAQNGDEGLAKVNKSKYDLVLLDIMMPGTPVRDIVKRIKETKVAFLSVVRTSDEEKRALLEQKNVKAFIQKPFDIDDLIEKVKRII